MEHIRGAGGSSIFLYRYCIWLVFLISLPGRWSFIPTFYWINEFFNVVSVRSRRYFCWSLHNWLKIRHFQFFIVGGCEMGLRFTSRAGLLRVWRGRSRFITWARFFLLRYAVQLWQTRVALLRHVKTILLLKFRFISRSCSLFLLRQVMLVFRLLWWQFHHGHILQLAF